jgi:hypothetical protein
MASTPKTACKQLKRADKLMIQTQMPSATTREHVADAIAEYHNTYRHPDLKPFDLSRLYDLFPHKPTRVAIETHWRNASWPNGDSRGVYLIWDEALSLRYIGRSQLLGKRLNEYFRENSGRGSDCYIYHPGWKREPRFVATIPVEMNFEAGALEEYLIGTLKPEENDLPWCGAWARRVDT